jgi:hypothetical protein
MGVTYDQATGLFRDDQTGDVVGYNPDFPATAQPSGSPIDSQPPASSEVAQQYVSASAWIPNISLFRADPNWPASPTGEIFNGVLVSDLRANGSQAVNPAGQSQTVSLSGFNDADRVLITWTPRALPNLGRQSG